RRPGRLLGREPLRERRLGERDLVLVRLAERRDLLRVLGLERVGRADMRLLLRGEPGRVLLRLVERGPVRVLQRHETLPVLLFDPAQRLAVRLGRLLQRRLLLLGGRLSRRLELRDRAGALLGGRGELGPVRLPRVEERLARLGQRPLSRVLGAAELLGVRRGDLVELGPAPRVLLARRRRVRLGGLPLALPAHLLRR